MRGYLGISSLNFSVAAELYGSLSRRLSFALSFSFSVTLSTSAPSSSSSAIYMYSYNIDERDKQRCKKRWEGKRME